MASLRMIRYKVREHINGQMVSNMKVCGSTIRRMAKALSSGQMDLVSMWAILKMI